ncbi:McrC family protein [Chitinophagales bacterium]|nr:McrC family protein [Chitinophagales bacterium]
MRGYHQIAVFEHQRLYVGDNGFKQSHLDALLKLNDFHQGAYFEPISKGVKFSQYVGVIQVDGLIIEIHPKADKNDEDSNWKGVLLKMLKACGKLNAKSSGAANVKKQNLNLLEVYFELFLNEITALNRRGLIKKYRKETSNVKALKGKLEFAGNIRQNLVHKERFYTSHQVYDTNHLIHQALYKALDIVEQFTRGTRLYDATRRVLLDFPEVDHVKITKSSLESIQLNRKSYSYGYALELARLIILNYSPDISAGKEKMLSLLFDMNDLWEEYVLKQLIIATEHTDIEVAGQESSGFWGNNTLRPDIVLRKGGKTYVVDTKWKQPSNNSASVSDLRQMYTYCRFWKADKAMLLYPGDLAGNIFKEFKTADYFLLEEKHEEIKHQCKMGYISVLNDAGELRDNLGEKVLSLMGIKTNFNI